MPDDGYYKNILDNLYDGVYLVDHDRRITYWNQGAEHITGYTADEVVGTQCFHNILQHVDRKGDLLCDGGCPLLKTLEDGKRREDEIFLHHKHGHRVPVSVRVSPVREGDGSIVGAVEVFTNKAKQVPDLKEIEELRRQALLDPLTDLGNRRYGEMQLHAKLNELQRYGLSFGVLFMDIDGFKRVNDAFGHDVGDEVLKMVARTLSSNVRSLDIVARWGGEEFVAVISHVSTEDELFAVAEKLRFLVSHSSISSDDQLITPAISIGGTIAQPDDTEGTLLKRADLLMYQSKDKGGNAVSVKMEE